MSVGIALVGAGRVAALHLDALAGVGDAELVAVVDPDESAARALAARYGADTVATTPREVLASAAVDAVIVAAPTQYHHRLAAEAIRAGKSVLVEKPLTTSLAEAQSLVDEAAAAGVTVAAGQVMRFMPMFAWAKEFVDAGRLGRPIQVIERRLQHRTEVFPWWRELPYFIVGHFGSHSVDLFCYLFDERPTHVYCAGASIVPGYDGIDDCTLHLRTAGGARMSSHLSFSSHHRTHDIVVVGTEATLTFDCYRSVSTGEQRQLAMPQDEMVAAGFRAQLDDFLTGVRTGRCRSAAHTALPSIAAIGAAEESLRTGGVIDVEEWQ